MILLPDFTLNLFFKHVSAVEQLHIFEEFHGQKLTATDIDQIITVFTAWLIYLEIIVKYGKSSNTGRVSNIGQVSYPSQMQKSFVLIETGDCYWRIYNTLCMMSFLKLQIMLC